MRMLSSKVCHLKYIAITLFMLVSSASHAIDLLDTNGRPDQLRTTVQSDSWTLVMLWAHDCIPCERQKPLIEKYYQENKTRGLTVVGVSTDSKALREKAMETYQASKTSFINYYFEGSDFSLSYGEFTGREFLGTPTYMVYNPNGELLGTHTGTLTKAMLDKQFEPVLKKIEFTPSVDLLR